MSIWAFAVRRWQFTLVMFALLIALGVASFASISRSEDPIFPFPAATVTLVWPGANPADMERLIVKPLEDAVNTLDNVKKIQSSAFDGLAVVHVEFYYGSDPEKKQDEVIREFNRIRSTLPADIAQIDRFSIDFDFACSQAITDKQILRNPLHLRLVQQKMATPPAFEFQVAFTFGIDM